MNKTRQGTIFILLSALIYSLNSLVVKVLSASVGSLTLSLIRFTAGIAAGFTLLYLTGQSFRVKGKKVWCIRGILGSFAMILYFQSIVVNGVAWSTLLANLASFFAALNGWLFFKKRITLLTVSGMTIAFAGVVIIYFTSGNISLSGTLLGLSVAFIRGFASHMIKKSSEMNHPAIVALSACLFGLLIFPFSLKDMGNLTLITGLSAFSAGVFVFIGQVIMTKGFQYLPVVRSSLLLYTSIPFSMIIGFLLGEEFSLRFLSGSLLIIAGILVEFRNEKVPSFKEIKEI